MIFWQSTTLVVLCMDSYKGEVRPVWSRIVLDQIDFHALGG
jgi:hypothetical protein